MSIFSNQSSVEVIAVASVFLTLSNSLALRLSPSPILLRALAVICLMLGRLNGFKYEHEAVKCHNSSLILLTKTAEEKKEDLLHIRILHFITTMILSDLCRLF